METRCGHVLLRHRLSASFEPIAVRYGPCRRHHLRLRIRGRGSRSDHLACRPGASPCPPTSASTKAAHRHVRRATELQGAWYARRTSRDSLDALTLGPVAERRLGRSGSHRRHAHSQRQRQQPAHHHHHDHPIVAVRRDGPRRWGVRADVLVGAPDRSPPARPHRRYHPLRRLARWLKRRAVAYIQSCACQAR